jgi:hypothetical protein
MQLLAHETGGLALLNSNDLSGGLGRVYQDTSTYYSIGVNLSNLPSTGYKDVRVEVSRPGITVRARRGFAGRTGQERARDVTQAALRTNVEYRGIPDAAPGARPRRSTTRCRSPTVPASS